MKTKVKICGVRDIETATHVINFAVDFLGFNFIPTSKRYINPKEAKGIIDSLRDRTQFVGIFKDQEEPYINDIATTLKLDYVQLHGSESPNFCTKINVSVIKALSISVDEKYEMLFQKMKSYPVKYFLLDRSIQGEGSMVSLDLAKKISDQFEIFFAGGLNIDNVSDVITKVQPFAVDVAGGVETQGKQDVTKIKNFISKVH